MTAEAIAPSELETIQGRVGNGIEWLTAHDTTGAFHLWFEAGIRPGTPMPAQPEAVIDAYREYHKQRTIWEGLWQKMIRLEKKAGR